MASEVGRAYVTLSARVAELEAGLARGTAAVNGFAAKADATAARTSSRFAAMGATMGRVGKGMSKWITLPTIAAGAAGMKMAGDFEKSMAKIEGLVGVARADVDSMSVSVRKMAAQYGKSAGELGDAMFFITSAGLKGKDAMDALEMSTKASVAGLGDTKVVADVVTSAMANYGKTGLTAADATDILTATVREGKLETEDLAGSMSRSLGIAANLGISMNEVGATLAAMSRKGTDAAEGVTQLRAIMTGLMKPTKQGAEAMSKVGLSYSEVRKQIREKGFLSALVTLTDALGEDAEAQTAVFQNVRALAGVMSILGGDTSQTAAIFERMTDNTGDGNKAFEAMAQTSAFRLQKALAQLKETLIQFGQFLAPVISRVAAFGGAVLSALNSLPGPLRTVLSSFVLLAAAAGPLLVVGGKLAANFATLGGAAAGAGRGLWTMFTMIGMGSGPLGMLTVGVAAGIAALFAFRDTTSSAQRGLEAYGKMLQTAKTAQDASTAASKNAGSAIGGIVGSINANLTATRNLAQAKRDLNQAMAEGKRAGESEAEYASRMAGLHDKVASAANKAADAALGNAEAMNDWKLQSASATEESKRSINANKKIIESFIGIGGAAQRATASETERLQLNKQAITAAKNLAKNGEARKKSIKEEVSEINKSITAVRKSSASDSEKAAKIGELRQRAAELHSEYSELVTLLNRQYTMKINTVITGQKPKAAVARYVGGYIPGFAGGGTVRGPGGKDRVPAMLTAGEVVLTKRQQALVDGGMSIRSAIIKTGGAYAKGGTVGPKRRKDESKGDWLKRVAEWKRSQREGTTAAFQQVADAITSSKLRDFDKSTAAGLKSIEGKWRASFDAIERGLSADTAAIEARYSAAFAALDKKSTAAFRKMDKEMRNAQRAMDATFTALTPAEAKLKALNDEAARGQLTDQMDDAKAALADANKAYAEAARWNNRDAMADAKQQIVDARKQIAEAERAQVIADLSKTAEAERAQREQDRVAAQDAFDEEWQSRRDALQAQLDGERAQLQAGLDAEVAARKAAADRQRADTEAAQAAEIAAHEASRQTQRAIFEDNLIAQGKAWARSRKMSTGNINTLNSRMERLARVLSNSGANVGQALADGLASKNAVVRGNAAALARSIEDFLRTHSPSKEGPLSDLNHWWDGFTPALMDGLDSRGIEAAVASATAPHTARGGLSGGAGGMVVNINLTDQTFAGMSREQADKVARQVQAALDRRVSYSVAG